MDKLITGICYGWITVIELSSFFDLSEKLPVPVDDKKVFKDRYR